MRYLLLLLCFPLFSQTDVEWYPIGSSYCFQGFSRGHFIEKDTLIQNRTFKILKNYGQGAVYPLTAKDIYITENDGLVELLWNNTIITLFDYNAESGDTVTIFDNLAVSEFDIDEFALYPFEDVDNSYPIAVPQVLNLSYVVMEKFIIDNDERERRLLKVQTLSNINWTFDSVILEGVGARRGMIGGPADVILAYPSLDFRYYCDDNENFFLSSFLTDENVIEYSLIDEGECPYEDCSGPPSSIESTGDEDIPQILILENYSLQLISNSEVAFNVMFYDITGRLIHSQKEVFSNDNIEFSEIPNGYVVAKIFNLETNNQTSLKLLFP